MMLGYEVQSEAKPLTSEDEARLLQLRADRAKEAYVNYANAPNNYEVFVHVARAATAAFYQAQFDEARQLAERSLAMAPTYRDDWNYGNTVHLGHTVLGLLALRAGDDTTAIAELRASADTPGSPQLMSFGPTMQLARALLHVG